jgi:phosphatidate cytidylyltransferase
MLRHRLLFGLLMIVGLLAILCLDRLLDAVDLRGTAWQTLFMGRAYPPAGLVMLALFITLILLGSRELVAIFHAKGIAAHHGMIPLAAITGCCITYAIPYATDAPNAVAVFATVIAVLFLGTLVQYSWRHQRTQGAVAVTAVTMFAFIYIGLLPGFYLAIRRWHGAEVIVAVILITKACDIGAYFTGRWLGRRKLIPWLSPGKTWEGLAGGVALSALLAVAVAVLLNETGLAGHWAANPRRFVPTHYPLWAAAAAGAVFGLVGQFGDLTASLFKRDAGVKDSGRSIPGFGGLLDVIDSPIVVAPLAYWLLRLAAAPA